MPQQRSDSQALSSAGDGMYYYSGVICKSTPSSLPNTRYIDKKTESASAQSSKPAVDEFARLAEQWERETRNVASALQRVTHPAHQRIMMMGRVVVPMILKRMRDHGGNWFWALRFITDEDPVARADRGKYGKMKTAWLRWGKSQGLLTQISSTRISRGSTKTTTGSRVRRPNRTTASRS